MQEPSEKTRETWKICRNNREEQGNSSEMRHCCSGRTHHAKSPPRFPARASCTIFSSYAFQYESCNKVKRNLDCHASCSDLEKRPTTMRKKSICLCFATHAQKIIVPKLRADRAQRGILSRLL